MKKIIIFFIMMLFIIVFEINFKYKIDMDIEILQNGSVSVTEVWDVRSIGGRDWCRPLDDLDLGGYTVSDLYGWKAFKVC